MASRTALTTAAELPGTHQPRMQQRSTRIHGRQERGAGQGPVHHRIQGRAVGLVEVKAVDAVGGTPGGWQQLQGRIGANQHGSGATAT